MVDNRRDFHRIKCDVKSKVNFVDMAENCLECTVGAMDANIVDISVESIKCKLLSNISDGTLENLLRGKKKARLNFNFKREDKSVNTFAIMVRYEPEDDVFVLKYQDLPLNSFVEIRDEINKVTYGDNP